MLEDSSPRSAFFFLASAGLAAVVGFVPGLTSLTWSGASAGFSAAGSVGIDRTHSLHDGIVIRCGRAQNLTPTPVPPSGFSSCKGAWEGWSLRGGSLGPVGVTTPIGEAAGLPGVDGGADIASILLGHIGRERALGIVQAGLAHMHGLDHCGPVLDDALMSYR